MELQGGVRRSLQRAEQMGAVEHSDKSDGPVRKRGKFERVSVGVGGGRTEYSGEHRYRGSAAGIRNENWRGAEEKKEKRPKVRE